MTDTPIKSTSESTSSVLDLLYLTDGLAERGRDIFLLAARLCIGAVYLMSGWRKLFDLASVAASFPARGLPMELGYVAPFVEFFGGLFIIIGFATRYSALVMLAFTIVASFSSHRYWTFTDPAAYAAQFSNFWKNMTMKGAMIALFVAGSGKLSIDGLLRRSR
jgi:putative oxidoreductase